MLAFVQRVGPEHRKDEVAHELLAQVLDIDVLRLDAHFQRFGARGFDLFALAEISAVKVTTSHWYRSCNHLRMTEVAAGLTGQRFLM